MSLKFLLFAFLFHSWIFFGGIVRADEKNPCLGEYELCSSGECVLISDDCGKCAKGQFLCPDRKTCVKSANDYIRCPNIKGTHYDWNLSVEERIDYLIAHTTLAERITQLTNDAPQIASVSIPRYNWLNEGIHGVCGPKPGEDLTFRDTGAATSFPNGCGLGATWSKERLKEVGRAIGIEARGKHNGFVHSGLRLDQMGLTFYTPNLNLVKDPRWGRSQEVYSEDPHLTGRLVVEYIHGMQNGPDDAYLLAGCCCKHYAAYDVETLPNGTDRYHFDANVSERDMWETYLPAFKDCVVEAKATSVMCSYNSINGVPTCGDNNLMNGILRDQWKWDGFVISDYDAVVNIFFTHNYVKTLEDAVSLAMNAGCDQEGGGDANVLLNQAVTDGKVQESTINDAFRRLFRIRIRLGMLDPPTLVGYNYLVNDTSIVQSEEHTQLARSVARESIVLLKNDNNSLPLDPTKLKNVAVIGPAAPQDMLLLGNYNGYPTEIVSILEGITALNFSTADLQSNCTYEQDIDYFVSGEPPSATAQSASECCDLCTQAIGCLYFTYYEGECYFKYSTQGRQTSPGRISGKCFKPPSIVNYSPGCTSIACPDRSGFDEAIQTAKAADATIVVFGLSGDLENEGFDRTSLDLPGYQADLLKALRAATPGKPLIGVLIHGGSLTLHDSTDNLDALIDGWYPGMQGGNAIADVLFGYYNPGGRTAVTWYDDISQLPSTASMDMYEKNGRTYRFFNSKVKYSFGYGLSYTTFEYSNLKVFPSSTEACGHISGSFTVQNTGSIAGDEVVQVYVKTPSATVPAPRIRLAFFDRIHLRSGESTSVSFDIAPESHSVVYETGNFYQSQIMVEKGELQIFVGGGQPDYFPNHLSASVLITSTQSLSDC